MPQLLDENIRGQLIEVFEKLVNPVVLLLFTGEKGDCEFCDQTRSLLEELTDLNEKLNLQVYDIDHDHELAEKYKVDKVPGIVLSTEQDGELMDYGIRYAGVPAGHEFTSLIRDILMVSAQESGLSEETKSFLSELKKPVHLQVFVTPSCPYCPQAVILAHQLAFESPMIQSEMVESMEFPELSDQFGVSGVPHTSINFGAGELIGAAPETMLIEKIRETINS